jgi:hypothetical protein
MKNAYFWRENIIINEEAWKQGTQENNKIKITIRKSGKQENWFRL